MIYVPCDDGLPINNRGTSYGDGFFSTMCVENGKIALFDLHCQRIVEHGKRLDINCDVSQIALVLRNHAENIGHGVLKLTVTSGVGGRGYARPDTLEPTFSVSSHPYPQAYRQWQSHGIEVGIATLKLSQQPVLAGLKHLNRLEQVFIKKELASTTYQDLLVCDSQGNLVEASAANIFWRNQGEWYTPALSECGVAGVMREFVLAMCQKRQVPVHVGHFDQKALRNADALMLTNAVMQILPVKRVYFQQESSEFDISVCHSLWQYLQRDYNEAFDRGY